MPSPTFWHGSGRNTKAYAFSISGHTFYISYETVIAYNGPNGRGRLDNQWGPMTGRHMKEMNVYHWPVVDEKTFEHMINLEVVAGGRRDQVRAFTDLARDFTDRIYKSDRPAFRRRLQSILS